MNPSMDQSMSQPMSQSMNESMPIQLNREKQCIGDDIDQDECNVALWCF